MTAVVVFFMGSPVGSFWMIYRAIRYENNPMRYIALAFVPMSFVLVLHGPRSLVRKVNNPDVS